MEGRKKGSSDARIIFNGAKGFYSDASAEQVTRASVWGTNIGWLAGEYSGRPRCDAVISFAWDIWHIHATPHPCASWSSQYAFLFSLSQCYIWVITLVKNGYFLHFAHYYHLPVSICLILTRNWEQEVKRKTKRNKGYRKMHLKWDREKERDRKREKEIEKKGGG